MPQTFGALSFLLATAVLSAQDRAPLKTWDGKHAIDRVDVTLVYFVPRDRAPLPDWKERVAYFCRRVERFHQREFRGQSVLKTAPRPEPFRSSRTTEQLRNGDANFIFYQTLGEVDGDLKFGTGERKGFPILLVLSDINWGPLEDFFRLKTAEDGRREFEGHYEQGRHFPGAASGGARATYHSDRGVGWRLVSADGWRVPYSGSDCVVYHEGVGHPIGLPHPKPGNNSVMSHAQYKGWINESWIDDDQKTRLGWTVPDRAFDRAADLFSAFTALPEPRVPRPGEAVALKPASPARAAVKSCRARLQTDLRGPWVEVAPSPEGPAPDSIALGRFDRPTPVSYRVDAVLADGRDVELWGYFQVRDKPDQPPRPATPEPGAAPRAGPAARPKPAEAIDLLDRVDLSKDRVRGEWLKDGSRLVSPKAFGARVELPYEAPDEYELTVVAEPLAEPNGLILGQRSGGQRFVALLSYPGKEAPPFSAIENVDGKNVGANPTTVRREVFVKGRPSQIVCTVKRDGIVVSCDGHEVLTWSGDPKRLSLSDYWKTPQGNALFLGAYDCRYRFHRVTLSALSGQGRKLR